MYGGATRPESYCKITSYIQHNAPNLYENIQDLCLFGLFNARGKNGVTFLLPDDKTLAKIDKLVGTDARKAVAMINALTIPMYLGSVSDFKANQSDIPNKLGNKLPIKDVSSNAVELSNGAVIGPAGDFKRLYDNNNINVFLIKGEVPTDGEASQSLGKKGGYGYRGGYSGGNDNEFASEWEESESKEWSPGILIDLSKSQIKTRMKHHIKTIDPLTHGTISLLYSMEQGDDGQCKQLATLLKEVMPVSPLAYWFILYAVGLKNQSALREWVNNPKQYSKREVLDATFFAADDANNIAVDTAKQNAVRTLNRANITSVVANLYKECFDKLSPESKQCAERCFGDLAKFCQWWQAMNEFCYLFTAQYVSAYQRGCVVEVTQIFHLFHNLVGPGLASENYEKCHLLTTEVTTNSLQVKERFCTLLSFMVSRSCVSLRGVKVPANVTPVNLGEKPNNVSPSTRGHMTIAFWDQLNLN